MRLAFKMKVNKDKFLEYEKRHQSVYKDLEKELKLAGASDYSIFLDEETGILFSVVKVEDIEKWEKIAEKNICKEWWEYMKDIMETNPDNSPKSFTLREVYHLD